MKKFMPLLFLNLFFFSVLFLWMSVLSACSVGAGNQSSSAAPATPFTVIGSWTGPNNEEIRSVYLYNTNLYAAAGYSGLIIFDSSLKPAGGFSTNFPVNHVIVKNNLTTLYAYLALETYNGKGGMLVLNVTDPTNVLITNIISAPALSCSRIADLLIDSNVYTADEHNGLVQYNVNWTTAATSVVLSNNLYGNPAVGIAVSGTNVFLAAKTGGFFVYQLGGPMMAQVTASLSYADAVSVNGTGNILAVADRNGNVLFYDITTPAQPLPLGSFNTGGSAYDVWLDGNDVYIAAGWSGVLKVKRTPPSTYTLDKVLSGNFCAYQLYYSVTSGKLYVACGRDGIKILK